MHCLGMITDYRPAARSIMYQVRFNSLCSQLVIVTTLPNFTLKTTYSVSGIIGKGSNPIVTIIQDALVQLYSVMVTFIMCLIMF